jgi:hypothetical protein
VKLGVDAQTEGKVDAHGHPLTSDHELTGGEH